MKIITNGKNSGIASFIKTHYFSILRMVIVVISLIIMLRYANGRSLWVDELWTISFTGIDQSWAEMFDNFIADATSNPPLFYIIAALWLRIVPYGAFWLRLISIIFAAIGIYLIGNVAGKIYERDGKDYVAVFATLFASTSWFFVTQGAFSFRSYGLLFLLSTLYVYVYILRTQRHTGVALGILLGLLAALLGYTHYFGLFVPASLFICDLVLLKHKVLKWQHMLSYILAAALYLPFFIPIFLRVVAQSGNFWAEPASFIRLVWLFRMLVSSSDLVGALFIFGSVAGVVIMISIIFENRLVVSALLGHSAFTEYRKTTVPLSSILFAAQVFTVALTVGMVFIYSRFINPNGSIFVNRYFIAILPQLLIVSAISATWLIENFIIYLKMHGKLLFLICICIVSIPMIGNFYAEVNRFATTYHHPFRELAEWIYQREDAHNPDTLIVTHAPARGFSYLLTQGGQRPPIHIAGVRSWNAYTYKYHVDLTVENHIQWNIIYRFRGRVPRNTLSILERYYDLISTYNKWGETIYVYQRVQ
ncbi:MAG: glycosyltransferase family 39 protein [Defluviitaleaceae bacterium]|nr:glycosyltransferase family 39 protein [Defluviitaleaceae bacterium]